jgi:hypothetical protein
MRGAELSPSFCPHPFSNSRAFAEALRCGHTSNKPENLIQQIGASKTSADAILPKGHFELKLVKRRRIRMLIR